MNGETLGRDEFGYTVAIVVGIIIMIGGSVLFLAGVATHDLYNLCFGGFFVLAGALVSLFTRINEIEDKIARGEKYGRNV